MVGCCVYIILYFISNDEEDVVDDGDCDEVVGAVDVDGGVAGAVAVAVASVASAAANTAVVHRRRRQGLLFVPS